MYKVVYAEKLDLYNAIEDVEKEVKELKSQGWVEQGGVSVSSQGIDGNYVVSQAMKK